MIEKSDGLTELSTLFEGRQLIEDLYISVEDENISIKTVGGFAKVSGVTYKGPKPITEILTDSNVSVSGYRHPILALTSSGDLDWKFIEDLVEGDLIVTEQ